ncbi:MAG: MBOAT family O-acyltransferase [Bulleidia sp.]
MVFSSLTFLYAYLPFVLIVYFLVPFRYRNLTLFIVSLFFYGWGEPLYIFVMLLSITMNWLAGKQIRRQPTQAKSLLVLCIIANLLLLGFFKYWDFFVENLHHLGLTFIPLLHLSLPIGISFYTFQAMSYPIDIYRGKAEPQTSLIAFGAYVTMFPQLIAGPIVRYVDVAARLIRRQVDSASFADGINRFTVGLCKKVLLANSAGAIYTDILALPNSRMTTMTAWIGIVSYALQIYFDFSGYSDMAIGLGRMLGFHFPENFNYPYIAVSVTDFWRRWHISLSTWFRDYVYIPMGGNRKGLRRQLFNIAVVWLLTGFWHGASWNFILWGILYGIVLMLEKLGLLKILNHLPKWFGRIYTLLVVLIAWVLFANTDLNAGLRYIRMLFGSTGMFADAMTLYYLRDHFLLFFVGILACTPIAQTRFNPLRHRYGRFLIPVLAPIALLICTAFIVSSSYNPFLYFRF